MEPDDSVSSLRGTVQGRPAAMGVLMSSGKDGRDHRSRSVTSLSGDTMLTTSASRFHPTRILLPTDFSASSEAALEAAADLAIRFDADLYVFHALFMLPERTGIKYPSAFFPQQEFLLEAKLGAESRLDENVAPLRKRGVRINSSVETGNDVVASIMLMIERERTDLIVISTHGLSGWRPIVFGSIAEKVVKLVQCPLLLLRSAKLQS